MANRWFKFKEFMILQDKCAMKVGTDGVILGAWTRIGDSKQALDIGTGTGLLSLMLAQRTPSLLIDALEIDPGAAAQANENIRESSFHAQINVINADFRDFYNHTRKVYDLIICNPPFFSDSMKPENRERAIARHSDTLGIEDLVEGSAKLLSEIGKLSIVLPALLKNKVLELASFEKLIVSRELNILTVRGKEPNRICLEFSFSAQEPEKETLIIEEGARHSYSEEYKKLTKDFYLDF